MTRTITAFFALMLFIPMAHADEKVRLQDGTVVRELPGNAYIVEGDSNNTVIRLNGDESIAYRALFGRYPGRELYDGANGAPQSDINAICNSPSMSISDRNDCIRDVIENRKELQEKYN
jgi:hypothetical protein